MRKCLARKRRSFQYRAAGCDAERKKVDVQATPSVCWQLSICSVTTHLSCHIEAFKTKNHCEGGKMTNQHPLLTCSFWLLESKRVPVFPVERTSGIETLFNRKPCSMQGMYRNSTFQRGLSTPARRSCLVMSSGSEKRVSLS